LCLILPDDAHQQLIDAGIMLRQLAGLCPPWEEPKIKKMAREYLKREQNDRHAAKRSRKTIAK
jgi:hypothetical protein